MPFYRTLGPLAIKQIFDETEAETLAGPSQDLLKYIKDGGPESVKNFVCLDRPSEELMIKAEKYKIIDFTKEMED